MAVRAESAGGRLGYPAYREQKKKQRLSSFERSSLQPWNYPNYPPQTAPQTTPRSSKTSGQPVWQHSVSENGDTDLTGVFTQPGSDHSTAGLEIACPSCRVVWATGSEIERISGGVIYLYSFAAKTDQCLVPDHDKHKRYYFNVDSEKSAEAYKAKVTNPIVLYNSWKCKCDANPLYNNNNNNNNDKEALPSKSRGDIFVNYRPIDNQDEEAGEVVATIHPVLGRDDTHGNVEAAYIWRCTNPSALVGRAGPSGTAGPETNELKAITSIAIELAIKHGVLPQLDPAWLEGIGRKFEALVPSLPAMPRFLDMLLEAAQGAPSRSRRRGLVLLQQRAIQSMKEREITSLWHVRRNFAHGNDLPLDMAQFYSPTFEFELLCQLDMPWLLDKYNRFQGEPEGKAKAREVWQFTNPIKSRWKNEDLLDVMKNLEPQQLVEIGWNGVIGWLDPAVVSSVVGLNDVPDSRERFWELPPKIVWQSKYDLELMDCDLVSVDVKAANFVAVSALADAYDGIFVGTTKSWTQFFLQFTPPHYDETYVSKRLRLVVLGGLLPSAVQLIEHAIVRALALVLLNELGTRCKKLIITSCDEVVLVPEKGTEPADLAEAAACALASARFEPSLVEASVYHLTLEFFNEKMKDIRNSYNNETQNPRKPEKESDAIRSDHVEEIREWLTDSELAQAEADAREDRTDDTYCILDNKSTGKIKFKHLPWYLHIHASLLLKSTLSRFDEDTTSTSTSTYE